MNANQAFYPVRTMARLFHVSKSGFYDFCKRDISQRIQQDESLKPLIQAIHNRSWGTYGSPRIHHALKQSGIFVSRKRVARLMQELGIQGVSRRRRKPKTTMQAKRSAPDDLVKREFKAEQPNQLWVADITYVPVKKGKAYLAVVMDVYSRKIVGWEVASQMKKELVVQALEKAVKSRQGSGVIHHSDKGSQYTSEEFKRRCKQAGLRQSTGRKGDCYDNAMCESFFATLECEVFERFEMESIKEAKEWIFRYIEGFYNTIRLHSSLDYTSPNLFELL